MSKPIIHGTAGDDSLTGTSSGELFALGQGGSDSASGLGGSDTFSMQGALDADDQLDGGAGNDVVVLNGDYSGGLTFTATTLTSVEVLRLEAGSSYDLTSVDATVAAGDAMTVDGSRLGAGDTLSFDGSAESDGHYHLIGGAGDDVLKGGDGGSTFNLVHGGEDTATGGFGNDVFSLGATLDAGDTISGGFGGRDVLRLDGDYSAGLTLGADTLFNIAVVQFAKGHSYDLTVDNANFLSGPTALINAGALGAGNSLTFNAAASDANFHFIGGAGDDVLTGGTAGARFDLSHGGNDSATGGVRDDSFDMGTTLTAADTIDGGAGNDKVAMDGMGAADSLTFSATTMVNVETLTLQAGHNYDLITNDATVAAGATLLVAGNTLGAGDTLTFDGSAETDGHFIIRGGAGNDQITGGALSDVINLLQGGNDTAHGGGGDDIFSLGNALAAGDTIDGGTGNDTLSLDGDNYAGYTFGAGQLTSVETLTLGAGHDYDLNTSDANVVSGATLTVDASALGAGNAMFFDGAHELDGFFAVTGGAGDDNLAFGTNLKAQDSYDGGAGNDELTLQGDYSAGYTFGAAQLISVETLQFEHFAPDTVDNFNITLVDGNVAAGKTLIVDGTLLGSTDDILVNAKAETDGFFDVQGNQAQIDFTIGSATVLAGSTFTTTNTANSLTLDGDFSGGATLGANQLADIQTLRLAAGNDYTLTTTDGAVQSGATLTVDGSALGATDGLTFDGSAETNGLFHITGGAGDDSITLTNASVLAGSQIDGGAGNDTLNLDGDFSSGIAFSPDTMTNVETLHLAAGHTYILTTDDANVASGATLTVDASALVAGDSLEFAGSAETDGAFDFIGGAGDDMLTGGAKNDSFDLTHGGDDTVSGGDGFDGFFMGAALTAADTIDGGASDDFLNLDGDYSAGFTFGATTITSVEEIDLTAGHSYNLTTNDANVAAGQTLIINAMLLGAGDSLTFDGAAETDGAFAIVGGAGNDTVTGGAGADNFDFTQGGNDTASGGGGDDIFTFKATFTALDRIDGGAGNDTVALDGNYAGGVTFSATTMVNVETLTVAAGHSYNLTTADATVASGATLTVDASALGAGNSLTFDGSAETDGQFTVTGGAGNDTLTGGAGVDTFDLSAGGTDTVHGGGGDDIVTVNRTLTAADTIDGGTGDDQLFLDGNIDGLSALVMSATTVTNISSITLGFGFSYDITTNDATVAAGQTLQVNALAFGGEATVFNGAAETDGHFSMLGGPDDDTFTGGALADSFDMSNGGDDIVAGGGGDDTMVFATAFNIFDQVDGGTGSDTLTLNGTYVNSMFNTSDATNIDAIDFTHAHSYKATVTGDITGGKGALTLDATGSTSFTLDVSAATSTAYAITGGTGNDTVTFGANFAAADSVDGGTGSDTLALGGAYAGTIGLAATALTSVETMTFGTGHSYTAAVTGDITTGGGTLTVNASALGAGDTLALDLSAATSSSYAVTGGAGDDTVAFGGNLVAGDVIDGGAGSDTLALNGDYSGGLTFGATTLTKIETLSLNGANGYNLTFVDGNVASGGTLTVDGSGASGNETVNGFAETDGNYDFIFGTGAINFFTGGAGNDVFDMSRGGSTSNEGDGNGGDDTFNVGANWRNGHTVVNGGTGNDTVNFDGDNGPFIQVTSDAAVNVEKFTFAAGTSYQAIFKDGSGSGFTGSTFIVDASTLGAADSIGVSFVQLNRTDIQFTGGAGNDLVDVDNTALAANSQFNGGAGNNQLQFDGDFSSSVTTFTATTVTNFETFQFFGGFSYKIATNDATVASGQTLIVDASGLGTSDFLQFDGSAETDGKFSVTGGMGNDSVTLASASVLGNSTFNGLAGNDTLELNGDFSAGTTFAASTIANVETLKLDAGHSYNLTTNDANVASGQTLTVNASALGAGNSLTFDGTAETNGKFAVTGGAGNDTVKIGSSTVLGNSTINGGAGNDTLELNGNFAGGFTFGATTMTSVETLKLDAGHTYAMDSDDGNVAAGATLTIDASALGAGNVLNFDGSAETDGFFAVTGGAGNDFLELGHATVLTGSSFNGGAGNDTLALTGNFSGGATLTISNVETLQLAANNSYNLTTTDGDVGSGQTLTVDATALFASSDRLTFNGAAETDGTFLFKFGSGFVSADNITGGAGSDTLQLAGATSQTFSQTTIVSVEDLQLLSGGTYGLSLKDGNIAAGQTLLVDASAATGTVSVQDSAETDGSLHFKSGSGGSNVFTGGAGADIFDMTQGGSGADTERATGNGGNDVFNFGANWNASSQAFGGAGSDTLDLNGDYSAGTTFSATLLTSIENITLAAGHNYNLTSSSGNFDSGATVTVDASALNTGDQLTFNGSAETGAHFDFTDGAGGDTLTGGSLSDTFNLLNLDAATGDVASGGGGNDTFIISGFGVNGLQFPLLFDTVSGGTGNDTLVVENITGASIDATNYSSIETVTLNTEAQLSIVGDIAGGGQTLNITFENGDANFAGVDLSQATSTLYHVNTGAVNAGVTFGSNFSVTDQLVGAGVGVDWDILTLNGDYTGGNALVFNATTMTGFQTIELGDGGSYNITLNDATIANGSFLDFDATQLVTTSHVLIVNDTAETNGGIGVMGGAGNDIIHGGAGDDSLQGEGGNDVLDGGTGGAQMDGGAGQDTITVDASSTLQNFTYDAVTDSTGSDYDIITGINFNFAQFIISGFDSTKVTAIDAAVTTGTLDTGANFDADLAAAIDAGHLGAHHAVLFTPNSSSTGLAGTSFLVVDVNGVAGYQAGADLVIDIGTTHLGSLQASEFI